MKERAEVLQSILRQLHAGKTVEDVKAEFQDAFHDVPATEIAAAERELMQSGVPVEEIQNLCDVHATLFEGNVREASFDAAGGHPLTVFSEENRGILAFLDGEWTDALTAYEQDPASGKANFESALRTLSKVDRHYTRKETLLFPYLERGGVTAPPKVMWGVDDEIRALLKSAAEDPAHAADHARAAEEKIRSMVKKEEEILKPMLIHHLTEADWKVVAQESPQIGYVFTGGREGASPSDAAAWLRDGTAEPQPVNDAPIQLPSGHFTTETLTAMLNSLPADLTFVGADDTVHFFSETKDRIFPRTRTIIGRNVSDCHPPKSLHVVEALVQAFKDGTKDSESFWIQKGDLLILIRYFAVRDADGTYLGVVETTEEISALQKLEGQKTLLS